MAEAERKTIIIIIINTNGFHSIWKTKYKFNIVKNDELYFWACIIHITFWCEK